MFVFSSQWQASWQHCDASSNAKVFVWHKQRRRSDRDDAGSETAFIRRSGHTNNSCNSSSRCDDATCDAINRTLWTKNGCDAEYAVFVWCGSGRGDTIARHSRHISDCIGRHSHGGGWSGAATGADLGEKSVRGTAAGGAAVVFTASECVDDANQAL